MEIVDLKRIIKIGGTLSHFRNFLSTLAFEGDYLNMRSVTYFAISHGRWDIVQYIIRNKYDYFVYDTLYEVYKKSNLEVFKELVELGLEMQKHYLFHDLERIYNTILEAYKYRITEYFVSKEQPPKGHFWVAKGREVMFLHFIKKILHEHGYDLPSYKYRSVKVKVVHGNGKRYFLRPNLPKLQ